MCWLSVYLLVGIIIQSGLICGTPPETFAKYPPIAKFNGSVILAVLWPTAIIGFIWLVIVDYREWRKTSQSGGD
jgi:hypothetical protein